METPKTTILPDPSQGGEISGHLDSHRMAMISGGGLWMFSCHKSYGGAEVVCYQVLQCCSTKVVPSVCRVWGMTHISGI